MEKPDVFGFFQHSLNPKKISGRFHFWTFGFLEVAAILTILLWKFVMKAFQVFLVIATTFWMFITSVSFGSQK